MMLTFALLLVGCGHECRDGDLCAVIGSGDMGFNGDGVATESWLSLPSDVLRLPDGRLLVDDYNNYRFRALNLDGSLETVAGSGLHAFSTPGAQALESGFENPIAVTLDADGLLTIAGEHEGRVLRISAAGKVEVLAGTGILGFAGDGGDPLECQLSDPTGVAWGPDGELYVSDAGTNRVRVIRDGTIDTIVGGGEDAIGPGTAVRLDSPEKIAWDDAQDRLIIADTHRHRVVAWDAATGEVELIAGTGQAGFGGDGGPAVDAQLSGPQAAIPIGDRILIADSGNNVLRVVDTSGNLVWVAGSGGVGPIDPKHHDPALEAPLQLPVGLFADGDDIFVADMLGQQVVRWMGGAVAIDR